MLFSISRAFWLFVASLVIIHLAVVPLHARWKVPDEAIIECLNCNIKYQIDEKGAFTAYETLQVKILNEAGRQAFATQAYIYDTTRSKLEIIEAKTTNGDIDLVVPKEKIEDKPLASDGNALSKRNQILVPFQQLSIGSIVTLRMKTHYFHPPCEKSFECGYSFNNGYLWKQVDISFESQLPLNFKLIDPLHVFKVVDTKKENSHTLKIKSNKPFIATGVCEPGHSCMDPETDTNIFVSTETDYNHVGKFMGKKYEDIIHSSIPQNLIPIIATAKNIKDETECINTVVTSLIERITYLSTLDSADGHHIPRSLQEIVTSGYGDCKEYSVCLAAVLNALGYQAKAALVNRGMPNIEYPYLPGLLQFNHAIVKVIGKSGRTYWIDPTNDVVMADGIFPDIADRPALILDPEKPTYERVPPIDYRHARFNHNQSITIKDGGLIIEGSYAAQGESALTSTQCLVHNNKSIYKDLFFRVISNNADLTNTTIDLTHAPKSRKVQPFQFTYSYSQKNALLHTNAGYAYHLESFWHQPYASTTLQDVGAIYVGYPETRVQKLTLKNSKAKNIETLAFDIKTPWVNAKRELSATGNDITITTTVEILKSLITAKELKSPQFSEFRDTLRKYCERVAILLQ